MANFALNTQGATPNNPLSTFSGIQTPQSKALNGVQGLSLSPINFGTSQSTPSSIQSNPLTTNFGTNNGQIPSPIQSPSSVVPGLLSTLSQQGGSHTISNTDGSSTTTKINPKNEQLASANPNVNPNANLQTNGLQGYQGVSGVGPEASNPNYALATSTGNAPQGTPAPVDTTPPEVTSTPNTNTNTYPGLVNQLITAGGTAASSEKGIADEIATLRQNLQTGLGNISSAPFTSLNFQSGRINALQTQEAAKEGALQQEQQAIIAGNQQKINTLGTAAGLAQPQVAGYGQTSFNPLTGQFAGGSDLTSALTQYAQLRASGQESLIPSSISGNPILNAQVTSLAQGIKPGFNANVASAQGQSSADLTSQASSLQASANGAEQNFNLLANIAKQGGVNNGTVPILNTLQQNVARGLTSNDAVVNFRSILQSVRDQYASILGGGTVTDAGRAEALQLIPDDISLSALQTVGQNLKSDATNRISGIQNQVQSLTGNTQQNGQQSGLTWDTI